ncbi:MAG TPA: hypothetical protein VJB38_02200 [Bacteroidota bacterium]|nr:hypothetical protein [Bacteroidota bacterium]
MIQSLSRSKRILSLLLIPSILLLAMASSMQGQTATEPNVRNADWNIVGDEIVVTYDLVGTEQGDYQVEVTFLNEANKSVRIPLKNARGDIGTVRGPAAGKTITWSYKNDIPATMYGEGFYLGFEIGFKGTGEKSGISFGGILLLVGLLGALFYLVAGGFGPSEE